MIPFINRTYILKGSKAIGLSIWIKTEDEYEINSIVVSKAGNKLSVINKRSALSIDEILNSSNRNLPIYLSIDGKGVLHKITESDPDKSVIELLLPNADSKDFVTQEISTNDNKKLISIVRKDRLDEILNLINRAGFLVLKVFLGPGSVCGLAKILENDSTIKIPYYILYLKNQTIEGFEKNCDPSPEFSINIESEILDSRFIVPFSNSIHHYIENDETENDCSVINEQAENFRYRRLFQMSGWTIIVLLFGSLLINISFFEHYRQKNQILTVQVKNNKELFSKIETLNRQIKSKEDFFLNNSNRSTPLLAYYSDRLAKDVPSGIHFTRLSLFPLQKQITSNAGLNFLSRQIIITGYTRSSNYLDSWIKSLKKFNWIKEISIKNFIDNSTDQAGFELEISLKQEL